MYLDCGASLSKQWHEGERSNNLVCYWFCTYVTRVGGECASVFALICRTLISGASVVVLRGHTPFNGAWLRETTSAAAQAARLALSLLTQSVFFLLCCFNSVACSVTFDSMFPTLLRCLRGPSRVTSRTRSMAPYNLPLTFTLRTWL